MAPRIATAIEIGRHKLRAVLASFEGGTLRVRRVLVEDVPDAIDREDPEELGAWIARTLEAADFPRGSAIVALPREHVGLKRLRLPTVVKNELPDMTRIALQRELPFDAERAVIDFVVVERDDASTTVVAVAVPEDVLRATRQTLRAAGLKIGRISLRATGCAVLLEGLSGDGAECLLAVDVSGDGAEFCVVENGAIRFSRAARLGDDGASGADDGEGAVARVAERIVTETRRSWMSYRIVEEASDVRRVAVMGDAAVTALAAPPIGEMLGVEAQPVTSHPLVTSNGERLDRVWPLAGLLLESALGVETIDFERPRRAVDLAARLRRRAVLAAAVLILALLATWTAANTRLRSLDAERRSLDRTRQRLAPQFARVYRDRLKLEHLERWEDARVDWLGHATFVQSVMPAPEDAVLDALTGTLDFRGVRFDRKDEDGPWSSPLTLTLVVDGEARDRAIADALREALVRTERYSASSSGADAAGGKRHPYGFTYRLLSNEANAPDAADASPVQSARTAPTDSGETP